MRPYTEGRLDRYRIGIPWELSEIRTQTWLSEGSLTCYPCHHREPIFYLRADAIPSPVFLLPYHECHVPYEPRTINISINGERITFPM